VHNGLMKYFIMGVTRFIAGHSKRVQANLQPKRGILGLKPALGLEGQAEQAQQQQYQRDHRGRR